jgi:uncharacterized protein YqfA (UPF0365 family)
MAEKAPLFIAAALVLLVTVLIVLVFAVALRPWARALAARAPVSLGEILAMRLRGNPPGLIIDAYLILIRRGLSASLQRVENTYQAHKGQVMDASQLAQWVEERRRQEASPG